MKIIVLTVSSNKNFNAGPKEPRDIINILKSTMMSILYI